MNYPHKTISQSEKIAILKILAWLCSRDRIIDEAEIKFLDGMKIEFDLTYLDIKALIGQAQNQNIDQLSGDLKTTLAKNFLLRLLLNLALADPNGYDSRERTGIRKIAKALSIPLSQVEEMEHHCAKELSAMMHKPEICDKVHSAKQAGQEDNWLKSALTIGGCAVVGTAALVATGGLAAPAIGGLIGANLLGLSGAAATSAGLAFLGGGSLAAGGLGMAGGTAVVCSALGLAGGSFAATKAARLVGGIDDFELIYLRGSSIHTYLGISGFLSQNKDFKSDWDRAFEKQFSHSSQYVLKWESKTLMDLGITLTSLTTKPAFASIAAQFAKSASSKALGALMMPAGILSIMDIIDNPWFVACDRAYKAGRALGTYLQNQGFGKQPVTLIGFSLGTSVILSALQYLKEQKAYGIIDEVYLLGGAVSMNDPRLNCLKGDDCGVVSGSVVNVYSEKDFVLGYVYRTAAAFATPIGLSKLNLPGIVNINVSENVGGHLQYAEKMEEILRLIRVELDQ